LANLVSARKERPHVIQARESKNSPNLNASLEVRALSDLDGGLEISPVWAWRTRGAPFQKDTHGIHETLFKTIGLVFPLSARRRQ
jgi:hypothetical protein